MEYPDKIIISGISGGLGIGLAREMPLDKIIGISRTVIPEIKCKQIILDIGEYNLTEIYIKELEIPKKEKVAIILAAGRLGKQGGIWDFGILSDWERTMQVNLFGNIAIIKAFLPNILETGYARIVFLAGGGAAYAYPVFSGYALSKVAIVREVENIAEQASNIPDFSIIALAPGAMETDMLKKVREAGAQIKTTVNIIDTVNFIKNFILMDSDKAKKLSGKFIHVKDDLNSDDFEDKWLLRRIE